MRFFLDTEFIAAGTRLDLISLALVANNGKEFYAVSTEFDEAQCSDWVRLNVLPHLPERGKSGAWMTRAEMAGRLKHFIDKQRGTETAEFWAYFAAYDWVLFCQLFGSLVQLPEGWNELCWDLRQWAYHLGEPLLPQQPEEEKHDALADARWNRVIYQTLAYEAQRIVSR
jgi:hypothetical protein